MKLAQSLALIITGSASFMIPFALASLFLAVADNTNFPGSETLTACPLKFNACECLRQSGYIVQSFEGFGALFGVFPDDFSEFYTQPGLCGSGQLDFRQPKNDGSNSNWTIYNHNGDGTGQGTCTANRLATNLTCPNSFTGSSIVYDIVTCSTKICF